MRAEDVQLIEYRAAKAAFNAMINGDTRSWAEVMAESRRLQLDGLMYIHEHRGNQREHTRGWATYQEGQGFSWGAAYARYEGRSETNFSNAPARRARLWEAKLAGGVLWHIVDEMRRLSRRWPDDREFLTEEQQAAQEEEIRAAKYHIGKAWEYFANELLRRKEPGLSPVHAHYEEILALMERFGRKVTRVGLKLLEQSAPKLHLRW